MTLGLNSSKKNSQGLAALKKRKFNERALKMVEAHRGRVRGRIV